MLQSVADSESDDDVYPTQVCELTEVGFEHAGYSHNLNPPFE